MDLSHTVLLAEHMKQPQIRANTEETILQLNAFQHLNFVNNIVMSSTQIPCR